MGFDITGLVLSFAGVGLLLGYVLGRIGKVQLLMVTIAIIATILVWHHRGIDGRLGRAAIGHAIILLGTIWASAVMIGTYIMVRLVRREDTQLKRQDTA